MFYDQQSLDLCLITTSGAMKFKILGTTTYLILNHSKWWSVMWIYKAMTMLFKVCFLSWKHKHHKACISTYKFSKSYLSLQIMWKWQLYTDLILCEIISSKITVYIFFSMARHALVGEDLITVAASRSHWVWHNTIGRTPLEEWSAHSRDFYLT